MVAKSTTAQGATIAAPVRARRDAGLLALEAPTVRDWVGDVLDPDLARTNVVIPNYDGKATGDTITMHWEGPASGDFTDSIPVTAPNLSLPIEFRVPRDQIKPNEGTTVKVYYTVSRNGTVAETSIAIYVPVGEPIPEPGDVEPPQIDGVAGGVLNLIDVPEAGASATVAPYEGMKVGDIVFIDINDSDWEDYRQITNASQVGQPVSFVIPKSALQKYSGTTIDLGTVVIGGGEKLESRPLLIRVLEPVGELPIVRVPAATGNSLAPEDIDGPFVEVIVRAYPGIAEGDKIKFRWVNESGNPSAFEQEITVPAAPQQDYVFEVPRNHADLNLERSAELSYAVTRGTTQTVSEPFELWFGEAFEAPSEADLSLYRYVIGEKPPVDVPAFAKLNREAKFGTAPYHYSSSDETLAIVDNAGTVRFLGNGTLQISATDSKNQTRSFTLTIKGLKRIFFVSHSANFAGAAVACATAGLDVPTLDDLKAFWVTYFPSSGPVADYMGWLSYKFWTGTLMGAGTAYIYDLNGTSEQGNVSGSDESDHHQVVGVTP